jgi:tetratricopeptide (TPR) repeat protein
MKRDAPHTGFSPRANRPFALSGSARTAPGEAAPSEPDATPCARALHRTGAAIMRWAEQAGISFFEDSRCEHAAVRDQFSRMGLYRRSPLRIVNELGCGQSNVAWGALGMAGVRIVLEINTEIIRSAFNSLDFPISSAWSIFTADVHAWRQTLDPLIWIIASVLAIIPGSFAIYRWWFYRDSRLPERLNELIAKEEKRLHAARAALLSAVQNPDARHAPVTPPYFFGPSFSQTVRNLGWGGWVMNPFFFTIAEQEIEVALVEIERRLHFCEQSQANCRNQEAAAYLVKGALAAARAGKERPKSGQADRWNRAALNHFGRALEIDSGDMEALEYVAHQQRILGQDSLALSSYQRLAEVTCRSARDDRIVASRAQRYRAEIYEKQYDATGIAARLTRAQACLDQALECLPHTALRDIDDAMIREVYGRVARKREQQQTPLKQWGIAQEIYSDLLARNPKNGGAAEGLLRVKFHLDEFTTAQNVQQDAAMSPLPTPLPLQ